MAIEPTPYEGAKYRRDRWVPHLFATELAIYEGIVDSGRTLANRQVRHALKRLIVNLQEGLPPVLADDEPELVFQKGEEVEFLIWNIRAHWSDLFDEEGPVAIRDLIGILRTLLSSMDIHAWKTGAARGYVDYLPGFIEEVQSPRLQRRALADDVEALSSPRERLGNW